MIKEQIFRGHWKTDLEENGLEFVLRDEAVGVVVFLVDHLKL